MKQEQPKNVYITEANNLLITIKEFKNGKRYGDEITQGFPEGFESVEWHKDDKDKDKLIGTAIPVYGVVNKDNDILTEETPFYFQKVYAVSYAAQMNRHPSEGAKSNKPYKVKKGYLFYPLTYQN